jgi:Fe-S-cluster-containing dehydrogenase component
MSEEKKVWRSLEEYQKGPKAEGRFNPFNNDFLSRREFMEWTSGMVAVLGASACTRMPQQKIIPYTKQPERIIPGKPLFFATSMSVGGRAIGLLVESHMGRPTKVEGNPDHPASLGTSDLFAQASVLSLYDPDRSQSLVSEGDLVFWTSFVAKLSSITQQHTVKKGEGLRILTEPVTSPSLAAQLQEFIKKNPQAQWHQYEPANRDSEREGMQLALGEDVSPVLDLTQAKVVVSLDSDFLAEPACPRYAHDFAKNRSVTQAKSEMNRLYCAQVSPGITDAMADHRVVVRASEVEKLSLALASECGLSVTASGVLSAEQTKWVKAAAADLKAQSGQGLVVVGRWQSPLVHALAAALNVRLKNVGRTVKYTAPLEAVPVSQGQSIETLAKDMAAGKVETLVILGGNPVYNAPADLDFASALGKVKNRIHCGQHLDETGALCNYHIPEAHYLEQWGDSKAYDGTLGIVQPLIAPLYAGKTHAEVLAALQGDAKATSFDLVRSYWKTKATGDFEAFWTRALNDGLVSGSAASEKKVALRAESAWAKSSVAVKEADVEVLFRPDPTVFDGRFANNGWLQEVPKPVSKVAWDNAAYMSPAMAKQMGVENEKVVRLISSGQSIEAPVFIMPGHAEKSVTLSLGYGRSRAGKLGTGAGFNAYPFRTTKNPWHLAKVEVVATTKTYKLACTQTHHSMEGRPIVRTATLDHHKEHPHWTHLHEHIPAALEGKELGTAGGTSAPTAPADYQWGMAINLSSCTGCNACVVACQAENNIPVVGKEEVSRGREMHWIRIDRYFEGELENPDTKFQPVACVQCETAPCEIVCPVGATAHDNEGLNNMVYNRCVGTKYCSNNCPYKVRRFNFFEYTKTITPSTKLVQNPDVTVRSRGVMEKCTYCVQRISGARIQAKNEGRKIKDGEVKTACQSACPSQAIFFGDISDPNSLVSKMKAEPQNYGLLEELNTKPRTTYLGKIVNPSPALKAEKPA